MSNKVIHVESVEQYQELKGTSGKLVVIDFSATWCPPCRAIQPKYEAMSNEFPEVVFLHVDVDDLADEADVQTVSGVPTFRFFKDGNKLEEFSGANEPKIRETIEANK